MAKAGRKRKMDVSPSSVQKEKPFKWNVGQQRVLDLLNSKQGATINEMLIAAGSRCFAKGTLVATAQGHVPIEEIKAGDHVLSVNQRTLELEDQQVLEIFHNKQGQSRKNIIFVLEDGTKIHTTEEHEIYQKDIKTPAGTIARRTLERGAWDRRTVSGEQFGQTADAKLEVYRRNESDEAGSRHERISPDDDQTGRAVPDNKNAPIGGAIVDSEPRELAGNQSSEQCPGRQPHREPGVGDQRAEQGAHDGSREANAEQRREKRDEQTDWPDRGESGADTQGVQSYTYETERVGGVLRYKRVGVSRRSLRQNVEARELREEEIVEIVFFESDQDTYDICVAHNHNYLVSEQNILVGNSGKTFLIISIMCTLAVKYPGSRQLVARKFFSHAKAAVWLDTLPKVIDLLFKPLKAHLYWNNTDYFVQFPNGSEIWLGGLDDKERVDKILGREYLTIFFNECSELDYETYTTVKTRLAQLIEGAKNRIFADENPPSSKHWTKKLFVDRMDPVQNTPVNRPERYAFLQIHPWENAENVSEDYLEMINNLPKAQRLRFYEGKFRDDSQYALWKSQDINDNRYKKGDEPVMKRIVVAVDPAVTSKDTSDETGIVVKGLCYRGHTYLLADYTGTYTPTEWAKKTVWAYHEWKADHIVAEVNNGGDLVETVIRTTE